MFSLFLTSCIFVLLVCILNNYKYILIFILINNCTCDLILLSLYIDNQINMDKIAREFLLRDDMEKHIENMSRTFDQMDFRQASKVVYPASLIMMAALLGVFSNCQSWNEIADFAEARLSFLQNFFPDLKTPPSHDTFRRFFCIVSTDSLENCYRNWAAGMREKLGIETLEDKGKEEDEEKEKKYDELRHIAIDGKTICNALNKRSKNNRPVIKRTQNDKKPMEKLHMVSAFIVGHSLSLGQERVEKKENEIVAIPRLLDELTIHKGDIITIDAMGCQKEIADKIIEKQGDYLLEVKDNHPTLRKDIEDAMEDFGPFHTDEEIKRYEDEEVGHGRIVKRKCCVCYNLYWLGKAFKQWKGMKAFGIIDNIVTDKATGESREERHYFITSLKSNPEHILKLKKGHWSIEIGLHWQLDVTFSEDDDRKRMNAAQNFSLLNKMALNVLKCHYHKDKKASIKRKRMKAGWDEDYLRSLLNSFILGF